MMTPVQIAMQQEFATFLTRVYGPRVLDDARAETLLDLLDQVGQVYAGAELPKRQAPAAPGPVRFTTSATRTGKMAASLHEMLDAALGVPWERGVKPPRANPEPTAAQLAIKPGDPLDLVLGGVRLMGAKAACAPYQVDGEWRIKHDDCPKAHDLFDFQPVPAPKPEGNHAANGQPGGGRSVPIAGM